MVLLLGKGFFLRGVGFEVRFWLIDLLIKSYYTIREVVLFSKKTNQIFDINFVE